MKRAVSIFSLGLMAIGAATAAGQEMPPPGQPSEEKPGLPRPIQRILINKQYRAGELTLFADKDDDKAFYYLPDRPQLALNPSGEPQISFLRWVRNDPSKPEGDGGGVFSATIRMGVSEEQLQRARAEIGSIKPGGRIVGPVMFSSGTFGISFTSGGTSNKPVQVVALGSAPLLDGQNAAVTVDLDRHASQVLWETFKTPKPALDFHFEMEVTGLHQPYKAVLEGDWDKIYKHTAFDAGIAHRYLGAEIHLAFEELRQRGAIKLEQEGKDEGWNARIQSAYNILASMMFDRAVPADPNAAPMAAPMPAPGGGAGEEQKGIYERAVGLLTAARTNAETARAKNAEIRERNKGVRERNAKKIAENDKFRMGGDHQKKLEVARKALAAAEAVLKTAQKEASASVSPDLQKERDEAEAAVKALEAGGQPDGGQPSDGGSDDLAKARAELKEAEKKAGITIAEIEALVAEKKRLAGLPKPTDADKKKLAEVEEKLKAASEKGKPLAGPYERVKKLEKLAGDTPKPDGPKPEAPDPKKLAEAKARLAAVEKKIADASRPTDEQKKKLETARAEVERLKKVVETEMAALAGLPTEELMLEKEEPEVSGDSVPPFAVLANFTMKRQRQSGHFRIDLNKYMASSVTMSFAGSVGDVRKLMNTDHFRMVNLDDALYKQRDVVAYVDGDLNAADFGRYVNYITVQLRKTHAKGDITDQQVRIDKTTFTGGNNFKMLYGWKEDNDRRRWLEYEYRTVWSFFGGRQVEVPWRKSQEAAIPLAPPFLRRVVDVDISPDLVEKDGVRAVTLRVFYDLGAGEQVKQMTLNTFRKDSPLSGQLEFMLPVNRPEYAYEVTYQVKGNRTVTSGRERTSSGALILEELPRG